VASTPAPLPSLGLLDGLGEPATPVDDRQGSTDHPVPAHWSVDPGHASAYAWYALGVLVANRDEVSPPPPPASGGSGGAAYLPHIGLLLETGSPPPPPPSSPTVTLTLFDKSESGRTVVPDITGVEWAWWDDPTLTMLQALATTPTDSGSSESVSGGVCVLSLPSSSRTSGQDGLLFLRLMDGDSSRSLIDTATVD
jgi:hypothetical protein